MQQHTTSRWFRFCAGIIVALLTVATVAWLTLRPFYLERQESRSIDYITSTGADVKTTLGQPSIPYWLLDRQPTVATSAWIASQPIDNALAVALGDLHSLEMLVLSEVQMAEGVPARLQGALNLRHLALESCDDAGPCVTAFGNRRSLEFLAIIGGDCDPRELSPIADLTALEELIIRDVPVDDQFAQELSGLRELIGLELSNTNVTARGARIVKHFPRLRSLTLNTLPLDEDCCRTIAALSELETLDLSDSRLEPGCLEQLAQSKSLTTLALNGTEFTAEQLAALSASRSIAYLALLDCAVDAETVNALAKMKSLTQVNVSRSSCDRAALCRLLPHVKVMLFESRRGSVELLRCPDVDAEP